MPTAYWYDEFMPLLLRACSVLSPADIKAWDEATDHDLNTWFSERQAAGEFENYGHATKELLSRVHYLSRKNFGAPGNCLGITSMVCKNEERGKSLGVSQDSSVNMFRFSIFMSDEMM